MKNVKIFFVGKQEHINGVTSAFSIGTDPDANGFMEEDFFVINAYDKEGNLLNADKKNEFFRL